MNRRWFFASLLALVPFVFKRGHSTLKQKSLRWGTYGKKGQDPLKWVTLGTCSTEHLDAILRTQFHITDEYKLAIRNILEDRGLVV